MVTIKNNLGLSLAEILVTVIIFVVLLASLYAGLTAGNSSWQTQESNIIAQREVRQALSVMKKELRESSNISITQDADNATITFTHPVLGSITYAWTAIGNDAGKIIRTLDGGNSNIIAHFISALSFTDNIISVSIDITATKTTGMRNGSFSLKEKIALR